MYSITKQDLLSPEDQQTYKNLLLQAFDSFTKFCNLHDIKYVAAYGTVLGAVRHKGLIPWDDDIDVAMDRTNYEKFLSLRNDTSLGKYEILDIETPDYIAPFAKFSDSTTTIQEFEDYRSIIGVFIDVFPIDEIADIKESKKLHKAYVTYTARYAQSNSVIIASDWKKPINLIKKIIYISLHSYLKYKVYDLSKKFQKIKGNHNMYYRSCTSFERAVQKKEWIEDTIVVPFESFFISIPRDYDSYLRHNYGEYMKLPPEEKRVTQHYHYFVDLNRRLSFEQIKQMKKHGN